MHASAPPPPASRPAPHTRRGLCRRWAGTPGTEQARPYQPRRESAPPPAPRERRQAPGPHEGRARLPRTGHAWLGLPPTSPRRGRLAHPPPPAPGFARGRSADTRLQSEEQSGSGRTRHWPLSTPTRPGLTSLWLQVQSHSWVHCSRQAGLVPTTSPLRTSQGLDAHLLPPSPFWSLKKHSVMKPSIARRAGCSEPAAGPAGQDLASGPGTTAPQPEPAPPPLCPRPHTEEEALLAVNQAQEAGWVTLPRDAPPPHLSRPRALLAAAQPFLPWWRAGAADLGQQRPLLPMALA